MLSNGTAMLYRPMKIKDLDLIMEIEKKCFASPWSRKSFEKELEKKYGLSMVAESDSVVAGYLVAWLIVDEIHVANLAVHPDFRRQGIAEAMMRKLIHSSGTFVWMGLEVRRSNTAARALYSKLGFLEVGIRKGYYQPDGEDAILMARELNNNPGA